MVWKTHIRITKDVVDRLGVRLTGDEYHWLKEGVIAPDKNRDQQVHHYGCEEIISQHLNVARSSFLRNDYNHSLYNLGVALHYIQDSYTTCPSFLPGHQNWEEGIEKSWLVPDAEMVEVIKRDVRNWSHRSHCMSVAQELSKDVQGDITRLG